MLYLPFPSNSQTNRSLAKIEQLKSAAMAVKNLLLSILLSLLTGVFAIFATLIELFLVSVPLILFAIVAQFGLIPTIIYVILLGYIKLKISQGRAAFELVPAQVVKPFKHVISENFSKEL